MNVDELPENLDEWPLDDFEILGVDQDADERTIKRAYAARIKRFKPERFPQHFRRLRDAYEGLTRLCRWRSPIRDAVEAPATDDGNEHRREAPIEPRSEEPASPKPDDRWDRACAGEHIEIYEAYRESAELRPTEGDFYVRLFWLLTAVPALEPGVDPIDWLCRGLMAGATPGRLLALLVRDLLNRPANAKRSSVAAIVSSDLPWRLRSAVAVHRWQAMVIADADPGEIVRNDLNSLADVPVDADDLAIKMAACEALLPEGFTDQELIVRLTKEAMERGGSEGGFFDFQRLDRLAAIADSTFRVNPLHLPRHALQIAALVNGFAMHAADALLWQYAEEFASNPWSMLDELDAIIADFPTVFYLLERGFAMLEPRNGLNFERKIDAEFWSGLWTTIRRYCKSRTWALEFCIRFWISPEELAAHARIDPNYQFYVREGLVNACNDPAVMLAWRIYTLAWTDYEPEQTPDPNENLVEQSPVSE